MNPYQYITKIPERSISILGISFEQFKALSGAAINQEAKQRAARETEKKRINKKGAGTPKALTQEAEICLTIYYLKHKPTYEVLGMQFDISRTTANTIFHNWAKIIRDILPASLMDEFTDDEAKQLLQEELEEKELIVDSSEQERARPVDNKEQRKSYSGKQKRHTFKNQIISLPLAQDIVDVTAGERGPRSDIKLFKESLVNFSDDQQFIGDKAYVGEAQIATPKKKPKGGKLTEREKENNRLISKRRVYIEHLIGRIKKFRIMGEKFPLRVSFYQTAFLIVCGLTRLQIGTFTFA